MAADSGKENAFVKNTFKPTLSSLYYYYTAHPSRMARLADTCEEENIAFHKPQDSTDTRWLSCDASIKVLTGDDCAELVGILVDLKKAIAEDKKDALAVGLYQVVRSYNFLATLLLFADVIPLLTKLTLAFQKTDADLSTVFDAIPILRQELERLRTDAPAAGSHLAKLPQLIEKLKENGIELSNQRSKRNPRSALAAKQSRSYARRDPAQKKPAPAASAAASAAAAAPDGSASAASASSVADDAPVKLQTKKNKTSKGSPANHLF